MSNDDPDNTDDDAPDDGDVSDSEDMDASDVEVYHPDTSGQTVSTNADAVFDIEFAVDDDSYLNSSLFRCPDHDRVLPVALPYVTESADDDVGDDVDDDADDDSREPDGFHLVCPRCRFTFAEYSVSDQQWRSR